MENVSLLLNSSDVNGSNILREFPYWQPTLAVTLFFYCTVPPCTLLFLYVPLVLILLRMKKENFEPLNLIHVSLLSATILEDTLRVCLFPIYLPSVFRYCVCSDIVGTILGAVYVFFLIYRPLCFASLSVLQLFVILGKKKFVNLKIACSMIALCIGVSLVSVASITRVQYESIEKPVCYDSYCPNSRSKTFFGDSVKIFLFTIIVSFLPSLAVMIVCSTWSCAVFKTNYTGGDDRLNRRILSLPFIMPLVIIASAVLEGVLVLSVGAITSMLSLGDLTPYWTAFTNSMLLIFLRFFIRLVYPLVLVYTHAPLRQAIKRLLARLKNRSNVNPQAHAAVTASTSPNTGSN